MILAQSLFEIGFLPVRWLDVLDVALTAILVYQGYRLIRGTIAVQVAVALLALYVVSAIVRIAGLTTLTTLFGAVSDVFVLAVLILFAPEIRQALFLVGRNPIVRRLVAPPPRQRITTEVLEAIAEMSRDRVGSLIAFSRSTGLRNYVETGTQIHADVERDLLTSIFYPNSPLHDGAVIIQGQEDRGGALHPARERRARPGPASRAAPPRRRRTERADGRVRGRDERGDGRHLRGRKWAPRRADHAG